MKKIGLKKQRFYKIKKPVRSFICALCSADREMSYSKNLSFMNYVQIALLSASISLSAWHWLGLKSVFAIFIIWPSFELINKFLYRKDIPCPYCGFDATWYRRDVKVAHKKVREFWEENHPELVNAPVIPVTEAPEREASSHSSL